MKALKEIVVSAIVAATLVAMLFGVNQLFAPKANAQDYFVSTTVRWGGTDCIAMQMGWSGDYRVVCGGVYTHTEGNVWAGDNMGFDPIMGAASWISCDMYINGVLSWSDYASRGDGSDVNCLRRKL